MRRTIEEKVRGVELCFGLAPYRAKTGYVTRLYQQYTSLPRSVVRSLQLSLEIPLLLFKIWEKPTFEPVFCASKELILMTKIRSSHAWTRYRQVQSGEQWLQSDFDVDTGLPKKDPTAECAAIGYHTGGYRDNGNPKSLFRSRPHRPNNAQYPRLVLSGMHVIYRS